MTTTAYLVARAIAGALVGLWLLRRQMFGDPAPLVPFREPFEDAEVDFV